MSAFHPRGTLTDRVIQTGPLVDSRLSLLVDFGVEAHKSGKHECLKCRTGVEMTNDMDVGPADRRRGDADEGICDAHFWNAL